MEHLSHDIFKRIIQLTKIIHMPEKKIATFWNTSFKYFVISPIDSSTSCLHTGYITCTKPILITLNSLSNFFNNFNQEEVIFAKKIADDLLQHLRALGYQFTHTLDSETKHSFSKDELCNKVVAELTTGKSTSTILEAPLDIWSFSLIKVFLDVLSRSFQDNVLDLRDRGYFKTSEQSRHDEIDALFLQVEKDEYYLKELADKLQEYSLFEDYEERFFKVVNLYKKNK